MEMKFSEQQRRQSGISDMFKSGGPHSPVVIIEKSDESIVMETDSSWEVN